MRRSHLALALAVSASFAAGAAGAEQEMEARRCFDAMAVAHIVSATPTEIPEAGPDVIVLRWPWDVVLDIDEVLLGPVRSGRLTVGASLHSNFNPVIEHVLVFLRRRRDGRYWIDSVKIGVVQDLQGRFVLPFESPLRTTEMYPGSWLPRDYEALLRPVRYRGGDAWWLRDPYLDEEELRALDPAWVVRSGRAAVARRGLFVDDLAGALSRQPGALCPPS